jgi:KDO2-lipid IV(A) lauroyltransferase
MADRTAAAFRAGAAIMRGLPEPIAHELARAGARGFARFNAAQRGQVERNLRRVHGPGFGGLAMRRAVRQTFESYGRYWAESFRLPGTSPAELDARWRIVGRELLETALEGGKGAILALPHLGGWEWAGFWMTAVWKHPISVVVEALEPVEVFEWFKDLREQLGMEVIALGPDAGSLVVRALKANHAVCLLSDRAIGGGGVEVEFFGERTLLPAGPATLALRTGAPLLPTAIYFRGRMHEGVVRPPVPTEREGRLRDDVTRVTQLLAHELEELIRAAPEQWHLLQPNWPSDPGYRV